jgi:hypothetical protein
VTFPFTAKSINRGNRDARLGPVKFRHKLEACLVAPALHVEPSNLELRKASGNFFHCRVIHGEPVLIK